MLLLSCGVYASSSENPASGMDEWIISDEAGAYGYYEYDLETKEGHFVPPSEIPEADYKTVPAEIPDEIFDTDEPDADITPFSVIGTDLRSKVSQVEDMQAPALSLQDLGQMTMMSLRALAGC